MSDAGGMPGGEGGGGSRARGPGAAPDAARRALIERLFFDAADLRGSARERFLDEKCGGDEGLRREVEVLLRMDEQGTAGVLGRTPLSASELPKAISAGADEGERLPKWIGAYRAVQRLGEGGFGLVYLAEQSQPIRRQVALKVIRPGMGSPQVVERFMAERQALALMDHPGLAKVFDAGTTEDGRPFFVMEYVAGVPITGFARREGLSIAARLELLIEVCEAVQHAHQKGVIHRDLKPSNILVESGGGVGSGSGRARAKVIDFGIAKALSEPLTGSTLHTMAGQMIGTPEYMSPEQAGSASDVDTRGDVYSLGVVLYELLTGVLPFESSRLRSSALVDVQRIIREEEPPRASERLRRIVDETASGARESGGEGSGLDLREALRQVRGDLEWITSKAMAKERDRRYASAAELAADLRRYLSGEAVLAGPPSARYRLGKWARRHKTLIAAGSVVLVAIVGGLVGTAWGLDRALREGDRAREAERQARLEAENARQAERLADAEADRARAEAVSAARVAAFLDAMLRGVGPEVAQGDDTTLLMKVLDKAASEIAEELAGEPLAEARLRRAIGAAYHGIQAFEAAEANLRRAVELFERTPGATLAELTSARSGLGNTYHAMGRLELARPMLEQVLEAEVGALGTPVRGAQTLGDLALLAYDLNELDAADGYAERALAIYREHGAGESDSACLLRHTMAMVANARGDFGRALELYEEALEISERLQGRNHPTTVTGRANVASQYGQVGRLADAARVLGECVEDARRVYGAEHSETITTLSNYGTALQRVGRLDEAEAVLVEAERLATEHLGEGSRITHLTRYNMGKMARARQDYGSAVAWTRRTVDGLAVLKGADDHEVRFLRNQLVEMLLLAGEAEEGLEVAREGIASGERVGVEDALLGESVCDAGRAMIELGRFEEALGQVERVEAIARGVGGRSGTDLKAWAADVRGRALAGLGRDEEAASALEDSYDLWVSVYGVRDRDARRVAGYLAEVLERLGRAEEAEEWRGRTGG